MLFIVSLALILSSIVFLNSIIAQKNIAEYFLSAYLLGYSTIVLVAQIAGFAGLLSSPFFLLFLQILLLAGIVFIWWKRGKPSLSGPFQRLDMKNIRTKFVESVRKYPLTAIFTLIILVGYSVLAWLIVRVPPNNSDSMHTHLARIIYWLQQGSFKQLNCFSIFAQIYPFDANLNMLWTVLFSGSDHFVGFIQFFAALACALAIFGICRILGGSRRAGLIVSLLWMTFPQNVFQATTTQNDMVVTALFITCLFFFFTYIKQRSIYHLYLSGLALGLAFGTKETMLMMGLGIVILLGMAISRDRTLLKPVIRWVLIGLASFLLLGSYPYFNNLVVYHNPFGPTDHVLGDSFGDNSLSEKLEYNAPRLIYQFFSIDSLPVMIANTAGEIRTVTFSSISDAINLDLESTAGLKDEAKSFSVDMEANYNEDESWFGPVSVLILVPGLILGTIRSIKKKDMVGISLAIFAVTFFICEIVLRPGWDPYQGRYFILSTAILMPLSVFIINQGVLSKIYTAFLYFLACIVFFMAVFSNESKPILGTKMFHDIYVDVRASLESNQSNVEYYSKRAEQQGLSIFLNNLPFSKSIADYDDIQLRTLSGLKQHEEISRYVEELVPEDATMGVILGGGTYDYVFFGPRLERKLISINPISLLYDADWVNEKGLEYVLISNQGRIEEIPSFLSEIISVGDWSLYSVNSIQ